MRQKFRFVGGNIHVRRAFRFAGLTGKTQFQCVLDVFVLPAVTYYFALEHLKEHVRASASAVFLFERHQVTWTHCAAITLPARPESNASLGGLGERTVVIGKLEMSFGLQWLVVRAQPQILRGQVNL